MKRHVTLKHIEAKGPVRHLVEELLDRLEEQTKHIDHGSVATHVAIEQNSARALFTISLTCNVPKKALVVHEEGHEAAATIREAFSEIARQVDKYKEKLRNGALHDRGTIREGIEAGVGEQEQE